MNERLKAMCRIAALQEQQKRLAEWRLAAIAQRKATLATQQDELSRFVEGGELVGRMASLALAQSQRLARRGAAAEDERRSQVEVVQAAERRLKLTERTAEQLAAAVKAETERRGLEDLIDAFASRPSTDLR